MFNPALSPPPNFFFSRRTESKCKAMVSKTKCHGLGINTKKERRKKSRRFRVQESPQFRKIIAKKRYTLTPLSQNMPKNKKSEVTGFGGGENHFCMRHIDNSTACCRFTFFFNLFQIRHSSGEFDHLKVDTNIFKLRDTHRLVVFCLSVASLLS